MGGPTRLRLETLLICFIFFYFRMILNWSRVVLFLCILFYQDYDFHHRELDPRSIVFVHSLMSSMDQGSSLAKSPQSSFSSCGPMYGINLTPDPLPRTRVLRIMDQGSSLMLFLFSRKASNLACKRI